MFLFLVTRRRTTDGDPVDATACLVFCLFVLSPFDCQFVENQKYVIDGWHASPSISRRDVCDSKKITQNKTQFRRLFYSNDQRQNACTVFSTMLIVRHAQ